MKNKETMNSKELKLINLNFNSYRNNKFNVNNLCDFLKKCKIGKIDFIAVQELPKRKKYESYINENEVRGLFEGEVEDKSSIYTGFYVINEKYKNGLVPNDEISQIWSSVIKYPSK